MIDSKPLATPNAIKGRYSNAVRQTLCPTWLTATELQVLCMTSQTIYHQTTLNVTSVRKKQLGSTLVPGCYSDRVNFYTEDDSKASPEADPKHTEHKLVDIQQKIQTQQIPTRVRNFSPVKE